jgi:hypothetical protein
VYRLAIWPAGRDFDSVTNFDIFDLVMDMKFSSPLDDLFIAAVADKIGSGDDNRFWHFTSDDCSFNACHSS